MIQKAIYNISIYGYILLIKIASKFNKKARQWVEGRKKLNYQLSTINYQFEKTAWFHCASLGEFEQGRPVIEQFRKEFPEFKILLTFFSPSGYEIRKNYVGADLILYLPADTPANACKFIEKFNPSIVFFVKYEFWRNYLDELQKRQIPTILFSAIFRENQVFFKWYGGFFRETLKRFNHILAQNQSSANLLQSIDYHSFTIAGDTRFDRVKQIVENKKEIEVASNFKANQKVFITGSVWDADMQVLIPFINQSDLKFIIAPHEILHVEIENWRKQINKKSILFSEAKKSQLADYQILIIDNIGILSSLYQYADFAYIGGSFGKGLHNILEAATYGLPIFFGDKAYHKFQEAVDLVKLGGAFAISDLKELKEEFDKISNNETMRKSVGNICENYVLDNVGATEKVIDISKKYQL